MERVVIVRERRRGFGKFRKTVCMLALGSFLYGCADVNVPGARPVDIPAPASADARKRALNERPDSVVYLPLGDDVLQPRTISNDSLPKDEVGPLELRGETLGGALQLILSDYDISLAFQSDQGLSRSVTVSNLHGPLDKVVEHVCGLADLYCAYEGGLLTVKDTQTFTVNIPPVSTGDSDIIDAVATGLAAITGGQPIIDKGTRTIVYTATHRTAEMAERYFQRMRSNTALIIFEIYIWEVSLNAQNSTGIDWQHIQDVGKFKTGINFTGSATADLSPISIGLPTTGNVNFGTDDVLQFISDYGAVKTISQPQIAVLSGAKASLRVADTVNYVSSLERTVDNGNVSVSTQTDSVDTGFTMTIASAWDNATIYGTIEINLQEFRGFKDFDADGTTLQLPETTERELKTQVRIRPGDSLLIAGLVRESDSYSSNGPGFMKPLLATSRDVSARNVELVFLLRPRIVAYTVKETAAPAQVPTASLGAGGARSLPAWYKAGNGGGMTSPVPMSQSGNATNATQGMLRPPVASSASPMTAPSLSSLTPSAPVEPGAPSVPALPVIPVAKVEDLHPEAIEPAAGAMPPASAIRPPQDIEVSGGSGQEGAEADVESLPLPLPPGVSGRMTAPVLSAGDVAQPVSLLTKPALPAPQPSVSKPSAPQPSAPLSPEALLAPVSMSSPLPSPSLSSASSPSPAPASAPSPAPALLPPEALEEHDYAPEYKKYYPDVDTMNPYLKKVTGP